MSEQAVPKAGGKHRARENRVLELGFSRSDLPLVRITLAASLRRAGLPEQVRGAFVLAVLEAVSNAIVHGGGSGYLAVLTVADQVWCEVTDRGPGPAAIVRSLAAPAASAGHGLRLAEALAGRLEVHVGPGGRGTTVALAAPRKVSAAAVH